MCPSTSTLVSNFHAPLKSSSSLLNCKSWSLCICGTPSEFVSSGIPSWQISTAHAQPFRGARDLAFCLKVPLWSLLVWASSGGSGETAWMRRLPRTSAARIVDKLTNSLDVAHLVYIFFRTCTPILKEPLWPWHLTLTLLWQMPHLPPCSYFLYVDHSFLKHHWIKKINNWINKKLKFLSRSMTESIVTCAQHRLRSAWAST